LKGARDRTEELYAEQIIGMLREAEVRLSQGEKTTSGLKVTQAARLKALEKENAPLSKPSPI